MTRDVLISRYNKEEYEKKDFIKMSNNAIAGSYLSQYPGDPLGAINIDIEKNIIPSVKGLVARELIKAAIHEETKTN